MHNIQLIGWTRCSSSRAIVQSAVHPHVPMSKHVKGAEPYVTPVSNPNYRQSPLMEASDDINHLWTSTSSWRVCVTCRLTRYPLSVSKNGFHVPNLEMLVTAEASGAVWIDNLDCCNDGASFGFLFGWRRVGTRMNNTFSWSVFGTSFYEVVRSTLPETIPIGN